MLVRPNKPRLPAAYSLPTVVDSNPGADQKAGVSILQEQDGTTTQGAWSTWTFQNIDQDAQAKVFKHLQIGKPWGTLGYGGNNGINDPNDSAYQKSGEMNSKGITYLRENSAGTCTTHYMVFQIGKASYGGPGSDNSGAKIRLGVSQFGYTLKAPVAPTAAEDPNTPKSEAKKLAVAISIAISSLSMMI